MLQSSDAELIGCGPQLTQLVTRSQHKTCVSDCRGLEYSILVAATSELVAAVD
jgi:hypothetical protein